MSTLAVPVLREVRLYGALGRQFGRLFKLAVATPAEAAQALCAVVPGFRQAFTGRDGRAQYHVFVGRSFARRDLTTEQCEEPLGQTEPIRFVPVISGAKRGGLLQTIIGVTLIVAGFENPLLVQVGVALVIGGVTQLLSPQRLKQPGAENVASYAFDGPVNTTEQGGPVPVALGRVICGSTVVSQGLSTSDLLIAGAYGSNSEVEPTEPTLPSYEGGGP